ncbi:helix-turn-helix domain-containing protein [Enterococcus alishanensis]
MFGKRLKELRKEKSHLTQLDMAKYLGVAKTTYASYEQGKRTPDVEIQNKIADYFDVTLDYLHGREQKKQPNLSPQQKTIATHIDENVSEEGMKEIMNFIEYIKQRDHSDK